MSKDKPIYVVGDSPVRSFSYSKHFIPLFIGPAAFNNFITEKASQHTLNKILEIAKCLSEDDILILSFNGDVRVIARTINDADTIIKRQDAALNNYFQAIRIISKSLKGRLVVCLPYPPVSDDTNETEYLPIYHGKLKSLLMGEEISFIDVAETISESWLTKEHYRLDCSHVSHTIVPEILEALHNIGIYDGADRENDYPWHYKYEIATKEFGPFKVWGDFDKEKLKLDASQTHTWDTYHQRTLLALCYCTKISQLIDILYPKDIKLGLRIIDCKEGLLAFELASNNRDAKITATDNSELATIRAEALNALYGYKDIKFQFDGGGYVEDYSPTNIIISFERYNWLNDYKLQFFNKVQENCGHFFYLSYSIKSDTRLLKKAGFLEVEVIGRSDEIMAHGELLMASNMPLPKYVKLKKYITNLRNRNYLGLLKEKISKVKSK